MRRKLLFANLFTLTALYACVSLAKTNEQLLFAKNQNQWEPVVQYKAYVPGGAVFLTSSGFTYSYYSTSDLTRIHEQKHKNRNVENEKVHLHAYRVSFVGGNNASPLLASEQQSFHYNYYLGKDQSKWATGVPVYKTIMYKDLYGGVDAKVYSSGTSLKYDFIVKAGADANLIKLKFDGVTPQITSTGDLKIKTSVNTIIEKAPYSYQLIDGKKIKVTCNYVLGQDNNIQFQFPAGYDRTHDLIIDPVLVFATYSGSTASTYGFSATYDLSGNLYAGGEVFAVGWPASVGAFQSTFGGDVDAGINKYSNDGTTLLYSTYYGGSNSDLPNNMIVTPNDELVVTGSTTSTDLPTTSGCYKSTHGGLRDIYVAKFNTTGTSLLGATYVGGSNNDGFNLTTLSPNYGDQNRGDLLIDGSGNIIVCGSSSSIDFPITTSAFQKSYGGAQDGVLFKLDGTCSNMIFSSYMGGTQDDACFSLAKTTAQDIVVVGGTQSSDFPTTAGALHTTFGGGTDGFVAIVDASGSNILKSTFVGTNLYDHAYKVQVNPVDDHVFVCGQTSGPYPVSPGVYSNANANIFIDELSNDLSTSIMSTRLGDQTTPIIPTAFMYDNCGNVYLCGFGAGFGTLPLTPNAHQSTPGGFWLAVLEPGMTNLLYATYMGGASDHVDGGSSRFDPQGIVYHSVCTFNGFTTTPTSYCPTKVSTGFDVASFKFNFEVVGITASAAFAGSDSVCMSSPVQFVNNSISATSYVWDFGDNTPVSTQKTPSHIYTAPGTYQITLYAHRPNGCITDDTAYLTVQVFHLDKPVLAVKDTVLCKPGLMNLSASVLNTNSNRRFHWEPASAITSDPDQQTVTVDVNLSKVFTVTVTDSIGNICNESDQGTIHIVPGDVSRFIAFGDTSICRGDTVTLGAAGGDFYTWLPDYNISSLNDAFVKVHPQANTKYTVLIQDTLGCEAEREVTVKIHPDAHVEAGEDFYIKYGESAALHATGAVKYLWSPAYMINPLNTPDPTVNPDVTTTYYLAGVSAEGCKAYDSITVHVTNTIIPSVFSPNGDGKNDVFYVKPTHGGVRVMEVSIYNRWGQRVFMANQTGIGWDGTFKGQPVEIGTYFYTITYAIGRKQYQEVGDLSLVR